MTRDKTFIPWDDDVDLVSVIGIDGLTEGLPDIVADAFRDREYFVGSVDGLHSKTRMTIKDHVRLSAEFLEISNDSVYDYPCTGLPAGKFT